MIRVKAALQADLC